MSYVPPSHRRKGRGLIKVASSSWAIELGQAHLGLLSLTLLQMSRTSIHSSSGALSIRSNPLNLFITSTVGFGLRSYLNGLVVFPTFFKSEFGNKQFMISATVSSQSCFCWLCRASPCLAAKNILNLILVLTLWWCTCAGSSLVLLEEGVFYDQCVLWAKLC